MDYKQHGESAFHFQNFVAKTSYTKPSEIKKLHFIFMSLTKYFRSQEKPLEDMKILEIGCGEGNITLSLSTFGCEIYAFDIKDKCILAMEKKAAKLNVTNINGSVNDALSFDMDRTFDVVVVSEVLEHVPEPDLVLNNIVKHMHRNSILIVTIPNGYGPWELSNKLVQFKKWKWLRRLCNKNPNVPHVSHGHCQFYRMGPFEQMFSERSLKRVSFGKSNSILAFFNFLGLNKIPGIEAFDCRLANLLPYWVSSGWYFAFQWQPDA